MRESININTRSSIKCVLTVQNHSKQLEDSNQYAQKSARKIDDLKQGHKHLLTAKNVDLNSVLLRTLEFSIAVRIALTPIGKEQEGGYGHQKRVEHPVFSNTTSIKVRSLGQTNAKSVELTQNALKEPTTIIHRSLELDGYANPAISDGINSVLKMEHIRSKSKIVSRWEKYTGQKAKLLNG